jgi:hypothetical protein
LVDELRKKSPLAPLLWAVFEKGVGQHGACFDRRAEGSASITADRDSFGEGMAMETWAPPIQIVPERCRVYDA